jgi:hypothetical protein
MIVIYFIKKRNKKQKRSHGGIVQILFKTEILVEIGLGILFPKGKRHSE